LQNFSEKKKEILTNKQKRSNKRLNELKYLENEIHNLRSLLEVI